MVEKDKKNAEKSSKNKATTKKTKVKKVPKSKELFKLDLPKENDFKEVLDSFLKVKKDKK